MAAAHPSTLPIVRLCRPAPGAPLRHLRIGHLPSIPATSTASAWDWNFNSAREYYDSISPVGRCRTSPCNIPFSPAGLGNEFASRSAQADLRALYPPVPARGAGLAPGRWPRSWNDPYGFTMGGLEGEAGSGLGRNHPFDLLRGFPADYCNRGNGGYLFNLEYRLPLFKIEKAVLPAVSLDRVYLNAFFDMGRLWHGSYVRLHRILHRSRSRAAPGLRRRRLHRSGLRRGLRLRPGEALLDLSADGEKLLAEVRDGIPDLQHFDNAALKLIPHPLLLRREGVKNTRQGNRI